MSKKYRNIKGRIRQQFACLLALIVLPFISLSRTDTLKLGLNKTVNYQGLLLTLLHKTEYHPMTGFSAYIQVEYDSRKAIIAVGIATCEPDLEAYYLWQGYTFKIPYPIEKNDPKHLTLVLNRAKKTSVEKVYSQENLLLAYQRLQKAMNVIENQPGSASGYQLKSESISLSLEYRHGKTHHLYDWQEFIAEYIQVRGQLLNQGQYDYGFGYRLLKSDEGEIIIYSAPINQNEEGLASSLKFLIDQE